MALIDLLFTVHKFVMECVPFHLGDPSISYIYRHPHRTYSYPVQHSKIPSLNISLKIAHHQA